MPLRLNGSTSGYSQLDAPAIAGDQTFTLPGTGGTIDRLNRAGNILQVVNGTYSTETSTTSTSFVDTGLSASITPTSATSKILILVSHGTVEKNAAATGGGVSLQLVRNATFLCFIGNALGYTNTALINRCSASIVYLDSPSTASSVAYKTQFNSNSGSASSMVQVSNTISTITLMEVAA